MFSLQVSPLAITRGDEGLVLIVVHLVCVIDGFFPFLRVVFVCGSPLESASFLGGLSLSSSVRVPILHLSGLG